MSPARPLADERYVLFTTYKKDGTPVRTPIWIVDLGDGELGFTTGLNSWKVKRLRRNAQVTLQPCSMRGEPVPGSAVTSASARVLEGDAEIKRVRDSLKGKYGVQVTGLEISMRLRELITRRHEPSCAIAINLGD